MTFNPGIDTFDQPLRDAWWTPGWTAQNQSYIPVPAGTFSEQGFPPGLTYVNVSGNYFDLDGNFISGYLTFWPSSALTITVSGGTTYLPQRFVGLDFSFIGTNKLGSGKVHLWNGQLAVNLLATDNSNMVPSTFTYHVIEHFWEGSQYDIVVPSASSNPVDIHSLIVPGSIQPNNIGLTEQPSSQIEIAAISTQFVTANVSALMGGVGINPTSYPVNFAFISGAAEPTTWHTGSWASSNAPYTAQILVGPSNGGLVLPVGTYSIWVQIVTPSQVPALEIGTLVIF